MAEGQEVPGAEGQEVPGAEGQEVPGAEGQAAPDDPVEVLRRWEGSGGIWRVVRRTSWELEVVLLTCDGGEEMGRLTSPDPALAVFVGGRDGSEA